MFPILYSSTETAFADNGIGILSGAISCEVEQKSTGFFELSMEYPTEGEEAVHWEEIQNRCQLRIRPTPKDSVQTFRIYEVAKLLNGHLLVSAQHISYDLSGYTVTPFDAYSAQTAISKLAGNCVQVTGFTFWSDLSTSGELHITKPVTVRSALIKIQEAFGGEFEWDNKTVRLYASRGADRGVTISYGKNLTDFRQEEAFSEVYTGIHPYWIDPESKEVFQLTPPVVDVPDVTFDFVRILPYDFSSHYDEKPTAAQLESSALYHIAKYKIGEPKVSMSVSFEQLENTIEYKDKALLERVSMYDTVHVLFPKFGGISALAKAVEIRADMLAERIVGTELGEYVPDVADTIAGTSRLIEERIDEAMANTSRIVQEAVENATDWITNGEGNVVIKKNASGQATEILIMDTADITTATKVWRWNSGGLGYSSNGYAGPYTTAITQDGAIVANFITAGVLSGDLIRTGALTSLDGDAIFNLDDQELRMNFDADHYMTFNVYGLEYYAYGDLAGYVRFQEGGVPGEAGVDAKLDEAFAGHMWTNNFEVLPYEIPEGEAMHWGGIQATYEENDVYMHLHGGDMHGFTVGSTNITSSWLTVYYGGAVSNVDYFHGVPTVFANYEVTGTSSALSGDLPAILIRNVNERSFQICYGGSGSTQRPIKWVAFDID